MHNQSINKANEVLNTYTEDQIEELDDKMSDILLERCINYGKKPNELLDDVNQRQSMFIQAMFEVVR